MAISPDKLIFDVGQEADTFEQFIDNELQKATSYDLRNGEVIIHLRTCPAPLVCAELKRRYHAAGWKAIDFTDDQRDGSWATLTLPDKKETNHA